jgi:hypothetical protein
MTMAAGDLRRLLAIGAAIGIEIGDSDLRVTVARVRPSGARILGAATIAGFRGRPAAEWGRVYHEFVRRAGAGHLAATVLLPRREVILRQLSLPGLSNRDLAAAIGFQIDSLHPFAEDEAVWAWARLDAGGAVLVAIVRREILARYIELFTEAGIRISAFTVSAAAVYSALRLIGAPQASFLALCEGDAAVEAYGEGEAKRVFSATFELSREKAAALAAADLRLEPGIEPADLAALLPRPATAPADYDLSRNALAYAAALAGACPRLALPINLLPAEHRSTTSRWRYVPTAALAAVLLAVLAGLGSITPIEDRKYLAALQAEIAKLEPQARRAVALDQVIEAARARSRTIDSFRRRSKADLDALAELTRLLAPPTSLTSLELTRQAAILSGQAEQAAPLLHAVDSSPAFAGSKFTVPLVRGGGYEVFRIQAEHKGQAR